MISNQYSAKPLSNKLVILTQILTSLTSTGNIGKNVFNKHNYYEIVT